MLVVVAYFAISYGSNTPFLNLQAYTEGNVLTPYQFRVLPMFLFRELIHSSKLVNTAHHLRPIHNDPYRLILVLIAFVSLLIALWMTRLTIRHLTGDANFAFWTSFLVAYMALLETSSNFGLMYTLPYDIPALAFFSASIYLIVSGRRRWFYALFPFAVLNRETACFAVIFFAIWEWTRLEELNLSPRARAVNILPPVMLMALVWIGIKLYLNHMFAHNATETGSYEGGLFAVNLGYNLHAVAKPEQWPVLLSICGFALPFLYLQRKWIRSTGLTRACMILMPVYFLAMMAVGIIIEIRIFTEWIALVVPALALIVHHRFRPVETVDPVSG